MTSLTGKIVKKKQGPVINTTPVIVPVPSYNPNDKDIHSEKSVTNPKYIGPGVWYTIHSAAKKACISGDFSAKKAFVDLMNYYRTNFSCIKCRTHIDAYITSHPFDPYWKVIDGTSKKDIGLFKWSWEFHNAVNKRIGKDIVDWETAYGLYFGGDQGDGVCSLDCGQ